MIITCRLMCFVCPEIAFGDCFDMKRFPNWVLQMEPPQYSSCTTMDKVAKTALSSDARSDRPKKIESAKIIVVPLLHRPAHLPSLLFDNPCFVTPVLRSFLASESSARRWAVLFCWRSAVEVHAAFYLCLSPCLCCVIGLKRKTCVTDQLTNRQVS